ncbi:MAG: sugar nucleotide-binding protein, partial [Deltaproteobacteria bacterium]|nr:sugar nucleotide-binding protein [Deltaproteobacteria bacterium]
MKKLLVTGGSGFLGWNLCVSAAGLWETFATVFRHPATLLPRATLVSLDLTDSEALHGLFRVVRPDAVIHAAAISNAEHCEADPDQSHGINVEVPKKLARLCAERGIPYLFTSSDLVFDGLNPPYGEDAPHSPVSHYGRQKSLGEKGVLEIYPDATICRLPVMFGL